MKRLGFIIFIGVAYPLSLLPMRVLYLFSDLLFLILFHLMKYRRNVVFTNLKNSFPEKTAAELRRISKAFYKNLCDVFIEVLKMTTISKKEIERRNEFVNLNTLEQLKTKQKQVICVLGHFGNWEWGGFSLAINSPMPVYSIYRPLSNPYFDKFMLRTRSRFGMHLVEMDDIYRTILRQKEPTLNAFIADQSPPNNKATYWTNFMSQDTPVFLGAEKIGAKLNAPIVFLYSLRVKRGYYKIYCQPLTEDPSKLTGEHTITELHVKFLDQLIHKYPDQWLWSHKRWKHKKII